MGKKTLSVRKNSDGTVTISAGRYKESIEIRSKTPSEKLEAVRWVILTVGLVYSKDVENMVKDELNL